jgi:hypothetical protein
VCFCSVKQYRQIAERHFTEVISIVSPDVTGHITLLVVLAPFLRKRDAGPHRASVVLE